MLIMIRLIRASEKLGITMQALGASYKYKSFLKKTDNCSETYFDIEAYYKHEATIEQAYAECTMLIEYLVKMYDEISYALIARNTDVSNALVSTHAFSKEKSLEIIQYICSTFPELVEEFDTYYKNDTSTVKKWL